MHRTPIVTGALGVALLWAAPACVLEQETEPRAWETSTGPVSFEPMDADPATLAAAREALGPIPLTGIRVRARVAGSLADVEVEQTFENRLDERLEAVYVFPLPDDAAVHELVMIIGERRIRADLRERSEARQAYEQARAAGQTASLLEQERPNVFTMSVANIQPGQPVRVLIRYVEELPYRDGRYHFHFPTTVGPRFVPGVPIGHQGAGVLDDTTEVPDASRITPAVLPEGVPTPYEVDFALELEAGMDVLEPRSASHDLMVRRQGPRQLTLSLRPEDRQPDRDIEASYALAAAGPAIGMLTHFDRERAGFFSLMFEPPARFDADDVRPKEMVFVLDTSGSMSGSPVETAKAAVRHALRNMNPDDTFQIVGFDDAASSLSPIPLGNTPRNVERGLAFLDAMEGGGGTVMTAGIAAALTAPPDPERLRFVLFLTDGFIGNEDAILAQIDREVGQARLFSLGVGSSVNRSLLDRMAERGRGAVQYVNLDEPPEQVVEAFYERLRNPILTDVTVDFHGFEVEELAPGPELIPDVFAGTPIVLAGRYRHGGQARVTIRGKLGVRPVSYELRLGFPEEGADRPAIAHLWARRQIDAIESRSARAPDAARDQVLRLALEHGLMSRYTSFVAIEERIDARTADPLRTVGVPVALPAGTSAALMGPQVLRELAPASPSSASGAMGVAAGGASSNRYAIAGPADSPGPALGDDALRGRRAAAPSMRTGTAEVRGALSAEVVRRYVRRAANQLRSCYVRALAQQPTLAGRITIRFVISPRGAVSSSNVASSTMGAPAVEQCLARSLERIAFPQPPGGGVVTVTYPFAFRPEAP